MAENESSLLNLIIKFQTIFNIFYNILINSMTFKTAKFATGGVIDHLLTAIHKHEKSSQLVGESIRALITLSVLEGGDYRNKISSESSIKVRT